MTADAIDGAACDFQTLSVGDLSRNFGRRRALSRVSFECRAASTLGVFGPNGAGKSTLLAVLSTLAVASSGQVTYGAKTAAQWGDVLRSRIGVLGHDLFLYGDLTAAENLEFFARLYGLDQVARRVERALDFARLTDRGHDRVSAFSRGMRQRLALERALVHEPRLVLLDEPFTGLDDASADLLVERLKTLKATGTMVVMATHDFDVAAEVVDTALCLVNGKAIPMTLGAGRLRDRYREAVARSQR